MRKSKNHYTCKEYFGKTHRICTLDVPRTLNDLTQRKQNLHESSQILKKVARTILKTPLSVLHMGHARTGMEVYPSKNISSHLSSMNIP